MKTVFWGNYKGGVGKTTSVFQIAGRFARSGKKVLLIDLDPQCSLSHICCTRSEIDALADVSVDKTFNYLVELYKELIEGTINFKFKILTHIQKKPIRPILDKCVTQVTNEAFEGNLYFIPSSQSFENARINELAQGMSHNTLNILAMALLVQDIDRTFDYVFFDCPPTTNILIQSVFMASDYYIVPTIVDEISAKGVHDYINEIEMTRMKYCMDPNVGGILINSVFKQRPQLIGIFETIYKGRAGRTDNTDQIANLDKGIEAILAGQSLLSDEQYKVHRYKEEEDGIATKHIFKYYIRNKDSRSTGDSVPKNTAEGDLTSAYAELADVLMTML